MNERGGKKDLQEKGSATEKTVAMVMVQRRE